MMMMDEREEEKKHTFDVNHKSKPARLVPPTVIIFGAHACIYNCPRAQTYQNGAAIMKKI
jgi:hypothetical protein